MSALSGFSPVDTWPDLRITIHVWPWSWQLTPRFYVDDVDGWRGLCAFGWLMLRVEWYGNVPLFREMARADVSSSKDATNG